MLISSIIAGWRGYALVSVLALVLGFGSAWLAQGWRMDAAVADLKAVAASEDAERSQAQLNAFVVNADKIKRAAERYGKNSQGLYDSLEQFKKEFKNATPLPADCKPDAFRVRQLGEVIDAANKALIGQQLSP